MFDAFMDAGFVEVYNCDWERENDYLDSLDFVEPCNCKDCSTRIEEGRCPRGY